MKDICRDAAVGRAYAEEATRLASERNLRLMHAWASGFLGCSRVELRDTGAGLDLLDEATRSVRAMGALKFLPHLLRFRGDRRLAHRTSAAARRLAEQDFLTAHFIAEEAGAHLLAWPAAVCLARVRREDGRGTEADQLVLAARKPLVENESGVTP